MTPLPSRRTVSPAALALACAAGLMVSIAAAGGAAWAGGPREPSVKVRAPAEAADVPAGGAGAVKIRFEMPAGYHVYAENDQEYIPVTIASKDAAFTVRERRLPPSKPVKFEGAAKPVPVYEKSFEAEVVLAAGAEVPLGERKVALVVGWQSCTEDFCEDPVQVALEVPVRVVAGGAGGTTGAGSGGGVEGAGAGAGAGVGAGSGAGVLGGVGGGSGEGAGSGGRGGGSGEGASVGVSGVSEGRGYAPAQAAPRGMLWQLLAALASGLLVTLTPCVYPLIPVTVSYFDQQGGGSRAKAVPLALAYGAGIIAMYAILGVVMARLGRDLGSLLGNAYVAWGFAAFFVLLALSMFGLYEITLPSSVATRLQSGERSGVAGAFLLGVTLGLVAAPCTGPVTGGLMLVVAQTGDVLFGLLAFGSFGLGLALPFSTLGVFSGALRAMPRAGAWMESVKHVFGYVLTAFAIYFAYVATGSNALTFALAGAWLLAAGAAAASTASVPARALGAALLAAGLYFLCGPYVIAPEGPIKSPERLFESRVEWDHDHDAALAAAKAQGKPVIVDFSARWCNACHELDLTTFRDDAVVREMARFVAVKVDVTSDEKNQRLKTETYKAFQIPFIAFYDSAGRKVASLPKEGASGITTEDVLHLLRETR